MEWARLVKRLKVSWIDVALAALFVGLTIVETRGAGETGWLQVAAMAALIWRRSFPTTVAVVVAAVVILGDTDGQTSGILALALATYSVGSELPPGPATRSLVLLLGTAVIAGGIAQGSQVEASDLAALFIFLVGPALIGMGQYKRTQALVKAETRAALIAERARLDVELATERERSRIARELHDVVSHSLTVVTIGTQAVRRALAPEQQREAAALSGIESTAREAGVEMRRILGVLRRDDDRDEDALTPQPDLSRLGLLGKRCEAAGLQVRLDIGALPQLSPGLEVTAFRIVQEAVTNVLRHARATSVRIRVAAVDGHLEVEVEDDGVGAHGDRGGHGLVGIRERVRLYEGTAEISNTEQGFRVACRLPLGVAP